VSSIPSNAVITSAKLYLYAKTNNINGQTGNPTFGTANTTFLQRVVANWSMTGTGWDNQPAITTFNQKILPQSSSTTQDYAVEMTDFVQSWVNSPDSNYGVLLRLQSEQYYNSMVFNAGQAPEALRPRLEICYTVPHTSPDSCKADFIDSIPGNNPLVKRFTAITKHTSNKKPVQICWKFGDGKDTCINYTPGSTFADYRVMHEYRTHGEYNVCVTIKYDGGCVAEKCKRITVFGAPPPPPCNTTIVIKGSRATGNFKHLLLDHRYATQADTSQIEMAAAAWTCNNQGSPTCNLRSLFRFELGNIPSNANITSARLYLYAKTNNINGYYGNPTYGANNTALLQKVTGSWTTAGTGWGNQPAVTADRQKVLSQSTLPAQNYVIDVSDFVQGWVKHPETNNGMLLRLQAEQYYNSMVFNCGQAPDSLQPRLEICYAANQPDSNRVDVKLYPNPTTGPLLAWIFTSNAQAGDIKLYDMYGSLKQTLKSSVHYYAGVNVIAMEINRTQVQRGNYFVKIKVGDTIKTFKIFVL
jgi:hypothetical protein